MAACNRCRGKLVAPANASREMKMKKQSPTEPTTLCDHPPYLIAALISARASKDKGLERVTRRRLEVFGIYITFADELKADDTKGGNRG